MLAKVSKIGLISTSIFCFLEFFARIVFPFGDEPDWDNRTPRFFEEGRSAYTPYTWMQAILDRINIYPDCDISAGVTSVWGNIANGCVEPFEQILYRYLMTIIIASPILLCVIFRSTFYRIFRAFGMNTDAEKFNFRLDAMSIAILCPGIIYYGGVLSDEQLFLFVALILFLVWGSKLLMLTLMYFLYQIDVGNLFVVVTFGLSYFVMRSIIHLFDKNFLYLYVVICISAAYFFGQDILFLVSGLEGVPFVDDVLSKARAINVVLQDRYFYVNYPLIMRPLITFMTGVFMSPSGLKSILAYVLVVAFLIILAFAPKKQIYNEIDVNIVWLIAPLYTILIFVFMLPTYSNAKYYIFMMPFLVAYILTYVSLRTLRNIMVLITVVILCNISLYHI